MRRAMTIIEMLITLLIAGILSLIVLPRASSFIDAIEVRGAVTEIESLLSTARHVAIARGIQSTLDIDPLLGVVSVRAANDTFAIREVSEAHGVTLAGTRASITYAPTGMGYGAANMSLVVTRRRATDTIFVSRLGRVRH